MADIYAVACVVMGVELLAKLQRRRPICGGARRIASLVHPFRSIAKSRELHETRVIMMAKSFFPEIETGLLEVMEREVEFSARAPTTRPPPFDDVEHCRRG